jgi:hypothetical protein
LILAALGGLLVGGIGVRLFLPRRIPVPPNPAEPVVLPLAVETGCGPGEFDPVEFGVPELEIETVAGTPELAMPAGLPTEDVGA